MELKRLHSTGTIIALCIIIATIQAASAAPTICVEPSYQSVSPGDTFTLNITVDPDGTEVAGIDYIIHFNNAVSSAICQNKGTFLGGMEMANITDNPNGSLDYGEYRTDGGVTDPGVLTTIRFEAISTGISELHFEHVLLSDPDGNKIKNVAICDGRVGIGKPLTPFTISGYVFNEDEIACTNPAVTVTNLNTCGDWAAVVAESSNYYQLTLASCADAIADDILRFDVAGCSQSNTTSHTVTQAEVVAGGFECNITLETAEPDTTPPVITDVANGTPANSSVTITWTTDEASDSLVKYGTISGVYTDDISDVVMTTSHSIDLSGLIEGTTYYFVVNSTDASDNPNESVEHSFTTSSTADIDPPVITNVANGTPTDSSVIITWGTDEASDSLVKYGNTSGTYTKSETNATMVTAHSVTLTGLSSDTSYYFVVNSTDASGNSNESEEHSFMTAAAESVNPPELVSCVITPTPPVVRGTNVSVDCLFSEDVDYEIRIEDATGALIENIGSGTATNPAPKWWNTTIRTPAGTYIVNVSLNNSTSGLSPYNDTNTIEVIAATEMPTVSIGSAEGSVGDTVNVSINITDALAICAMDIRVAYNASILNATDVANGSMIGSLSAPLVAYHAGYVDVNISCITLEAINGDGELFIVTFDVVGGDTGDSYVLALEAEAYTNDTPPQPVDMVTKNGVVNVTDGAADTTPPTVIGNLPTGTDVPVATDVTVTFDEAMNQTSAEGAFSITPDVDGAFSWSGNIMTFTPGADLADNTTYDVTISTGAKDLAGNQLAELFTCNFTTGTVVPGSTTVSIEDVTVSLGESIVVPIMVNYVTNLGGCELNMTYNESVVHVTDVTPGDLDLLVSTFDNGSGWMYANAINASGLDGDVVFAYVNLTAMGSKGDASLLDITVKDLFDVGYDKVTHTVIDGTFTIGADTEPPLVTDASASRDAILNGNDRPRAPGTNVTVLDVTVTDEEGEVANVTIDLSSIGGSPVQPMERITGTDVWTVTTNATDGVNLTHQLTINATDNEGNYNNTVAIELTVLRRGDVHRDNIIDGNDVMYIARYLAGLEPECSSPPAEMVLVGDVVGTSGDPEGDGIVDLMDAVYIARYEAGLEIKP
ncbi:MAG: cohesin domain-containing protein [Euryarchaeota archaeon]|nr:cohesin domain-containing protein [Euryarchaeota archaeon]